MADLQLFDAPPLSGRTRVTDPATSVAAAKRQSGGVIAAILNLFVDGKDWTRDELSFVLEANGWHGPTVVSAATRLLKAGTLRESGATRPSRRGCESSVLEKVTT